VNSNLPRLRRSLILCLTAALLPAGLAAGGPKYVAGSSYFNAAVLGQPVHWPTSSNGTVTYYVDQGPLSASVNNQQATAMVDAAAALWSAVPTAAVSLIDAGSLNEDVNGANIQPGTPPAGSGAAATAVFASPADVTPSATNYPIAVIFDADGSVINTLFGAGASDATSCQTNGVFASIDNINPDATIAHAILLLNGLCANTAARLEMMSFQLERAFGRLLGLDASQVNPGAFTSGDINQTLGLPVMQPMSGACGSIGGACIPQPNVLRFDDIAALNRIYPITAANLAAFPGKQLTAPNTVSITGTLTFANGTGMQGVNVVARPLDANGNPLYQYTVTAVSGALFTGKWGNAITGFADSNGNLLTEWGSNNSTLQGSFDLSGIPLPPGMTTAAYQITFEPINPLYMLQDSVGPYIDGSPAPSGTMPIITVSAMAAGSAQYLPVFIGDSALGDSADAIGAEASPRPIPSTGQWTGRLSQIGQTDWFVFPIRGGRTFTLVTQALNESGIASESKALPAIGVWSAYDPIGSAPEIFAPGLNGYAAGESFLSILSPSDDVVRFAIADMRGDGRPDYSYLGWLLYADTVSPARLPASGGPIVIHGVGFRPSDTVVVGGKPAIVVSTSPDEITAIAPASSASGSADVEVDDLPVFSASTIISGGVSYDAGTGDSLTLVTAPANTVPSDVPLPFTVTALGPNLAPAGGVTVTFTVTSGAATLGCGQSSCSVTATGDGIATMTVAASGTSSGVVTASLTNGASLQAHFTGGTAPILTALTPPLSLAAGATLSWTTRALVLNNGTPMSGQAVAWQISGSGITAQGSTAAISNGSGIATDTLIAGPLAEGQQATSTACVNGTSNCTTFTVNAARPEYASIEPVSGTAQSMSVSATPAQIILRVRDIDGNPMAGGSVTLYQALYAWTPPCSSQGRCDSSELLATQASTAISAIDGTVLFAPASLPGVPTNMIGLAATGNSGSVSVTIEQHP